MKIKFIVFTMALFVCLQSSMAFALSLEDYKYPFKGEVLVKMRLADICDKNNIKNTIKKRGIPESGPQYKMMVEMFGSQCAISRENHIVDSVAYDVQKKTMLEVLDEEAVNDVNLFQITLREYELPEYVDKAWAEYMKQENSNTLNAEYRLVKGAYNTAVSYMKKDAIVIQIDMMQAKGDSVKNLNKFSILYSDWIKNK